MTTEAGDTFTADWVLGADGANSQVRQTAGFSFEGMTYPERFLVASTTEDLESILPGISAVNYVFDPTEWLVLLRTPEHWRILFPTDPETPDEVENDPARVQERLRGVADLGRDWDVLHTTLYRVHQRVADTFRKGRLLLMGDAAHINNPLGGMGMNSGIHDAYVETTALLALIQGAGTAEQLDEACEARRQVALSYVKTITHDNWEKLRQDDPESIRAYHDELRELAADRERMRKHLLNTSMINSLRGGTGRRHGRRPDAPHDHDHRRAPVRAGEPRPHRRARRDRRRHRPGRRRRGRGPGPLRAAGLGRDGPRRALRRASAPAPTGSPPSSTTWPC